MIRNSGSRRALATGSPRPEVMPSSATFDTTSRCANIALLYRDKNCRSHKFLRHWETLVDEGEIRTQAWNNAIHAHGTYVVFSRRERKLRRRTRLRDFFGVVVPILVGFAATTAWIGTYKEWWLSAIGAVGLLQPLTVVWSLLAGWDEDRAYSNRAARDSYELQTSWERIGKGEPDDLPFAYRMASEQQRIIDSHDIERGITHDEKRLGMRAALFNYGADCVHGHKPDTPTEPKFAWKRCAVCGNRVS